MVAALFPLPLLSLTAAGFLNRPPGVRERTEGRCAYFSLRCGRSDCN